MQKIVFRYVVFDLDEQWKEQREALILEFERQGIRCGQLCTDSYVYVDIFSKTDSGQCNQLLISEICESMILFTDNRDTSMKYKADAVCIGCDKNGTSFFEGAQLVTDDLASLDLQFLEELYLHAKGLPVTIAKTPRLVLREIMEADFADLYRISRQKGMEYAFLGSAADENIFEPERLQAYCSQVYRFYGYGLWSVLKKDGTLIGCCGIADFEFSVLDEYEQKERQQENPNCTQTVPGIELQYMLDNAYQGYGFAQEMCRAVLTYVFRRTEWEQIWIRTHIKNQRSRKLALKLGFQERKAETDEIIRYCLNCQEFSED